ncbi:MAG TPA: methyltransferase domain-containing protein [Vicinamibacterales bacterium]|nr:methyltransferase domain-containing protein [Vicinamibacterales bacterium]
MCPVCHSLERHRLSWQFLKRSTNLFDASPKRMLHVAPEPHFGARLRALPNLGYVSFDWSSADAAIHGDLTAMPFASGTFDVIFCSHVLEHIPDDHAAMRECARVLRPSGWAVFLVPIVGERTDEDLTVVDPAERLARFGQADHVRVFGMDFVGRLASSGFEVDVVTAGAIETTAGRSLGLQPAEPPLFYCRPRR